MASFIKGLAKTVVILFNIILAVLGVTFIVLGSLLANAFKQYTSGTVIKVELIWGPVAGLLVLGLWLVITSICGIVAVLGSNQGLAKSYLALLIIIVVIEIVLAICFIIYKQPINGAIDEAITSTINKAYAKENPDVSLRSSLDNLQKNWRCCGSNGPSDYTNSSLSITTVPDSCCVLFSKGCAASPDTTRSRIFMRGCKSEVEAQYAKYSNAVIATGGAFAFMEVCAIIYTIYMVRENGQGDLVRFV